jgi:hypothetical protein
MYASRTISFIAGTLMAAVAVASATGCAEGGARDEFQTEAAVQGQGAENPNVRVSGPRHLDARELALALPGVLTAADPDPGKLAPQPIDPPELDGFVFEVDLDAPVSVDPGDPDVGRVTQALTGTIYGRSFTNAGYVSAGRSVTYRYTNARLVVGALDTRSGDTDLTVRTCGEAGGCSSSRTGTALDTCSRWLNYQSGCFEVIVRGYQSGSYELVVFAYN